MVQDLKPKVASLVQDSLREVAEQLNISLPAVHDGTLLFGRKGVLDSLGLVHLITLVEQKLEDEHGQSVTLADEQALAQAESPFHSIGSLTNYICFLMKA
jgi:acyl carrier protein